MNGIDWQLNIRDIDTKTIEQTSLLQLVPSTCYPSYKALFGAQPSHCWSFASIEDLLITKHSQHYFLPPVFQGVVGFNAL